MVYDSLLDGTLGPLIVKASSLTAIVTVVPELKIRKGNLTRIRKVGQNI